VNGKKVLLLPQFRTLYKGREDSITEAGKENEQPEKRTVNKRSANNNDQPGEKMAAQNQASHCHIWF